MRISVSFIKNVSPREKELEKELGKLDGERKTQALSSGGWLAESWNPGVL